MWQHSVGASFVLSSDPWACALVLLASPARLAPSPLPFASCPLMLSRAGPGRAPEPPARRPLQCARSSVHRSPACSHAYTATPGGGGSEGPRPSLICPTGVLSPISGAQALEEGLPIRTLGKDAASLVDGVWGILRPPHGRSRSPGLG